MALVDTVTHLVGKLEELRPSPMRLFGFIMFSYFLITAGIAYDVINEPPAIGGVQDPVTGYVKPQAFMPYRINGQYIIEGLGGGMFYALGGLGIVLLDRSRVKGSDKTTRQFFLLVGLGSIIIAYTACMIFIRIKMPSYLLWY